MERNKETMTNVLKELVEFTEKYPLRPEHYEALRDHEQSRAFDTLKLLKAAIPALKALLSQEAELREWLLERGYHTSDCPAYGWKVDTDGSKRDCKCGYENLRALIRRHHEREM